MSLDPPACYRALTARDARFDGVFFVGVTSTKIYCRPVCRARTPRRANCRFFANAAAAERAGFRPCLRCRPELAPGRSSVDATITLAEQASRRIAAGAMNAGDQGALARELGVSTRHLRRAVGQHLGVSPIDLATTHRLLLAKRLLHETTLPVTHVAFASGFDSLRRFNAAFRTRYRLAPTTLRRDARAADGGPRPNDGGDAPWTDDVTLTLEYRRPLEWDGMLAFLAARATPGVEVVSNGGYARTMRVGTHAGVVTVTLAPTRASGAGAPPRAALVATISPTLVPALMPLLARLRDMFDLDANPDVIARHLVRGGLAESPSDIGGIRVPGCVDGFELAVRAILGQQVSVKGATTLMGRFVAAFGEPLAPSPAVPDVVPNGALGLLTPRADDVAAAPVERIAALGMPAARAAAIRQLAIAVADGTLTLAPGADVRRTMAALTAIPGIGEWTAQYVAMRALRWPDAFPASDLALRRAAGGVSAAQLERHAAAWSPWRAYAAMHLWRTLARRTPDTPSASHRLERGAAARP